jgi:signal peptidase I
MANIGDVISEEDKAGGPAKAGSGGSGGPGGSNGTGAQSAVWETVRTIVYALLIALVVRTFAFEPFSIPSGSMKPTLLVGDYLFVSKYTYGYSRYSFPLGLPPFSGRIFMSMPERGDVVVFKLPTNPKVDYIKRVIGLPGETLQVKDGRLYIDGKRLGRERIDDWVVKERSGSVSRTPRFIETLPGGKRHVILESMGDKGPADNTPVYKVPEGHVFMMGDNRDNSTDSRFQHAVGFVPLENLVGKARRIFFSIDSDSAWKLWQWPGRVRAERLFTPID